MTSEPLGLALVVSSADHLSNCGSAWSLPGGTEASLRSSLRLGCEACVQPGSRAVSDVQQVPVNDIVRSSTRL